ncbi:DNA cytosine methyltransferase [Streptomyces sp. TRM66268-LWL]|uniref:DNA (cytosine-5-)-methyltransferase n=1 Tax=Streptomyces polyasparticus TaxID=2767826 RepID=A0ABR7STE1_9ACTN|nr:DNA cytosine methyltransferase [Streptomyces polyasparticus]MBC9718044.1 DNA cytosine methyltransferase [Streptomyces polyasparticus]
MRATDLTVGSLCSGIGGLDLGVQDALGGRIAWHAETDPQASAVLARHWPGSLNHGDVRTTDFREVEPVDVLTTGFPCQGLSVAGPRTGLSEHSPSGLWPHIVTAASALRPHMVVIENVRGILSTRAGIRPLRDLEPCPRCLGDPQKLPPMRALGAVLADLAEIGYDDCRWTCVRASDVGAAHRRERVFLVAARSMPDKHHAVEDPEPHGQQRLPSPSHAQGRRPGPLPGRQGRAPAAHPTRERRREGLTEPALSQRRPHPCLHRGRACRYGEVAAHSDDGGRARRCGYNPETQGRSEPPYRRHSPAGWWAEYLPAIRRWEHVTGHPAPRPTVPGTRRLSADLVEWLMGFEKGWVTGMPGLSRVAQLHLLGNSVVPQQAAHALRHLLADSTIGAVALPWSACVARSAGSAR